MKAPSERSATANAILAARKARGFTSAATAAQHVREQTRVLGLSDSVWAAYESDARKLSVKHREAIEAVFGPLGDQTPDDAPAASDVSALVGPLTDLVTQMTRRNDRDDRVDALIGQIEVLSDLVRSMKADVERLEARLRAHEEGPAPHGAPTRGGPDAPPSGSGGRTKRHQAVPAR